MRIHWGMFPCHLQILAEVGELRKGVEGELAAAGAALEEDAREDTEVRGPPFLVIECSCRGLYTQHVVFLW